jgi:hypothetical protein
MSVITILLFSGGFMTVYKTMNPLGSLSKVTKVVRFRVHKNLLTVLDR